MDSREYREQLKKEYKEHYRAIKEMRTKLEQQKKKARIANALNDMNTDGLMDSMQDNIDKLKLRMYEAEARFEAWMDSDDDGMASKIEEAEEFQRKKSAREMLESIRADMKKVDKKIEIIQPDIKTEQTDDSLISDALIPDSVKKSIGPATKTKSEQKNG